MAVGRKSLYGPQLKISLDEHRQTWMKHVRSRLADWGVIFDIITRVHANATGFKIIRRVKMKMVISHTKIIAPICKSNSENSFKKYCSDISAAFINFYDTSENHCTDIPRPSALRYHLISFVQ